MERKEKKVKGSKSLVCETECIGDSPKAFDSFVNCQLNIDVDHQIFQWP